MDLGSKLLQARQEAEETAQLNKASEAKTEQKTE